MAVAIEMHKKGRSHQDISFDLNKLLALPVKEFSVLNTNNPHYAPNSSFHVPKMYKVMTTLEVEETKFKAQKL
jgi:hypothetical protein